MRNLIVTVWGLCLTATLGWAQAREPLILYTFDAGRGSDVKDASGHGYDGKIVGAGWTRTDAGPGLEFDGSGDYVESAIPLDSIPRGDVTVTAWVKLNASPFPNGNTNWYVVDCEEYTKGGFMLRVDGAAAKVCCRFSQGGASQYAFSRATLDNGRTYHLAFVRRAGKVTLYVDGQADVSFDARDPDVPARPFTVSSPGQSFHGVIYEVRLYDCALTGSEILDQYKRSAGRFGKDTSWFGRISMRPYERFDRNQMLLEVDLRGVMPFAEGSTLSWEIRSSDGKVVRSGPIAALPDSGQMDVTVPLGDLAADDYAIALVYAAGDTRTESKTTFRFPPSPPSVPSPAEDRVGPLEPERPLQRPGFQLSKLGGFRVTTPAGLITVESAFSFPQGGENAFAVGTPPREAEPDWKVTMRRTGDSQGVVGEGRYYRIERSVEGLPGRVVVRDSITNKTAEPLGVLIAHSVRTGERKVIEGWLAGSRALPPSPRRSIKTNPTVFLRLENCGVGLVALDDVFIVQSAGRFDTDGAAIGTSEFALDAGATYTLEWAVYVNETGNYYDLVNAVRRDEGRNFVTVEGGFALAGRRDVPPREYLEIRNARYVISPGLSFCADDPTISLEGIEFMEYPKEKELVTRQMLGIREVWPEAIPMFHVAHSLYATNRPERIFPDSRVIQADGTQAVYPYEYGSYHYIKKERVEEGWRWWIYYPTLDNSFGKALLKSVDVMVDEMGCKGVFMDGFMWAYGGEYTYDRWDGHTAEIDPKTKTIVRKRGSVLLLSQPALVAFVEKMNAKGGTVIANNAVITRTMGRLRMITDKEITEGPDVHLAQTPITMGNPAAITAERDIYDDVLAKLAWGNLYMYYGEKNVTYPSVPQQMYPITVEEIRSGLVRGKERLITTHSGIYGWRDSADLHFVHRYDGRGYPIRHEFLTTVDQDGVRTRVALGERETAVVKRIPVTLHAEGVTNVICTRYDATGITLVLNGTGPVSVQVAPGPFDTRKGARWRAVAQDQPEDAVPWNVAEPGPSGSLGPIHIAPGAWPVTLTILQRE